MCVVHAWEVTSFAFVLKVYVALIHRAVKPFPFASWVVAGKPSVPYLVLVMDHAVVGSTHCLLHVAMLQVASVERIIRLVVEFVIGVDPVVVLLLVSLVGPFSILLGNY